MMAAPTVERYTAVVTSTEDPEQRGRIRVSCAGLMGDDEGELPEFIEPALDWGWFVLPDVGELVEIEVTTGSEQDESFGQASIDNLSARWYGTRHYGNEDGQAPTPINDAFKTSYGKVRGFATPTGHFVIFDDTEGATKVIMTWVKEKDNTTDISQLTFDVDGTIKLSVLGKHTVHLKENEIEVKLNEGASLKITDKDANATTVLGDGAVKAAIADHLKTFYNGLKAKLDAFDAHVHPTGMGPSGPPTPTITADPWDAAIESTKLTFPDG